MCRWAVVGVVAVEWVIVFAMMDYSGSEAVPSWWFADAMTPAGTPV